jgi:hypothetical protein
MTGRAAAMQPGAVNATMAAALAGFAHLGPRVMSSDPWVNEEAERELFHSPYVIVQSDCLKLRLHSCCRVLKHFFRLTSFVAQQSGAGVR